jgi:ABC-type phosphate transport system substrate-binding protein
MSAARARLAAAVAGMLTVLCAGLLTAAPPAFAASYVPIAGAGSTGAFPAIDQWIADIAQFGLNVNYIDDGSSTGRSQFAAGVVDWAQSDIPYGLQDGSNVDTPPTRGYAYMPDLAEGLAFVYNLHIGSVQVTNLRLSGATIAGIFTNKITMWNDPAIAADNPGLALPAERIVPVVRSDGSGATSVFTQWMLATQPSYWNAYCAVVGSSPCTQTSSYPVEPGTDMVAQPGDVGVAGYVTQPEAEGAIGYVANTYALETGFPVANVLNAAGYYTAPTFENIAVSLLQAQFDMNPSDALYLTANLSGVYTDTDPRNYELSYYSYMILPTDTSDGFTSDEGYSLGAFGSYLLCQGQQQVDFLGYSALPISLVEAGYAQLQKIPGNQVTAPTSLQQCDNPTYTTNGTNALANNDPMPPACDQQGPTQCLPASLFGSEPVFVAVPATGTFTLTVPTGTVSLAVSGSTATGALNPITVSDTRNTYPGWSVSGQASNFTGSGTAAGQTIQGVQLGWVPTDTALAPGAALGPTVAPASPGLGAIAAVLASAQAGSGLGASVLGANLTLAIPSLALAGAYADSLTVTAVTSLP